MKKKSTIWIEEAEEKEEEEEVEKESIERVNHIYRNEESI